MMMQTMLTIMRAARDRGGRAVLLVPEGSYELALRALVCLYPRNAGRTAKMENDEMLTVLTPRSSVDEISRPFHLYLSGWGMSTSQDEKGAMIWLDKAGSVTTEIS
jgi:hypothetical protein